MIAIHLIVLAETINRFALSHSSASQTILHYPYASSGHPVLFVYTFHNHFLHRTFLSSHSLPHPIADAIVPCRHYEISADKSLLFHLYWVLFHLSIYNLFFIFFFFMVVCSFFIFILCFIF